MGYPGLEPGTNRLKAEYSTIELAAHLQIKVYLDLIYFASHLVSLFNYNVAIYYFSKNNK